MGIPLVNPIGLVIADLLGSTLGAGDRDGIILGSTHLPHSGQTYHAIF